MPHIIATLKDGATGEIVNDSGVTVSIEQNEWLQGYKEISIERPDTNGQVDYEGQTLTQYRLSAEGTFWDRSEQTVDTGFDFVSDIDVDITMHKKTVPLPVLNTSSWFRDIGLSQAAVILLVLMAIAAIAVAGAYATSKVAPAINTGAKIAEKRSK